MVNIIVTRQRVIESCSLFNILPRSSARAWEPQNLLWKGNLILEELLLLEESDREVNKVPMYRIKFVSQKEDGVDIEETNNASRLFCETQIIRSLVDFQTVIQNRGKWFQVAMLCEGQRRYQIALELRIRDEWNEQQFRDTLLRITDEYEIFQDIHGFSTECSNENYYEMNLINNRGKEIDLNFSW